MTAKPIVFCATLATAVMTAGTNTGARALSGVEGQEPRRMMMLDPSTALRAGGEGQLGVMVEDTANGVRIGEVNSGSAAEKAGLKEGDLVTDYDGERVRSARQLTRLVQETPEGRSVKIGIQRNGQKQTVDATLKRDLERGLRQFQANPPAFDFRYNEPRSFSFRMDDMPGMLLPSRGRLGVTVESLSPQLAEYFGAKDGGALVSSVTKDSAADKAGLKAGDVITSIDGDHVGGADALTRELSNKRGEVSIGILRDKKSSTVKATIAGASSPPR